MATEQKIQSGQRSHIYGLCRELGMSTKSNDKSDDLHLLIDSRLGKDSLTKLTYDEANSIISELNHRQRFGEPAAPCKKFVFVEEAGGISVGQYNKIVALMCELRKFDIAPSAATIEQRVAGIIKRYLHMTVSPDNPYSWLSCKQGIKLIHCTQGILNDARNKAERSNDAV